MAEQPPPPCAEILWRIENFTYCWQEKMESLKSAKFFLECLGKTSWRLKLFPKGDGKSDGLGFYLKREEKDEGNEIVDVKFEVAVMNNENSPYKTLTVDSHSFKQDGTDWGWTRLILRSDLVNNKDKLYPKNVLTLRCKMWPVNSHQPCYPNVIHLRTLIPVTQCSFVWYIHLDESDQEKTTTFRSLFGSDDFLKFELSYVTQSGLLKTVVSGAAKKEYSFKCDIQIVQTNDNFFLKLSKINMLPYEKFYEPLLTQDRLVNISKTCALKGTLGLQCELSLISHEEKNFAIQSIEKSEQSKLWYPKIDGKYNQLYPAKSAKPCSSLKADVLKMYEEGLKSDFTLQVESRIFPIHSCILSARSAVLRRMFDTEMRENQEKILKIEDLDEKTVKKMLDYVYKDSPGELDIDSATKLYYAGDKYELFDLKNMCSEYMVQNIAHCNLYEILITAYRHNDEDLKSSVYF